MLLEEMSFNDISSLDVQKILGRKENNRLAYKSIIGNSPKEKIEFLRDICATINHVV